MLTKLAAIGAEDFGPVIVLFEPTKEKGFGFKVFSGVMIGKSVESLRREAVVAWMLGAIVWCLVGVVGLTVDGKKVDTDGVADFRIGGLINGITDVVNGVEDRPEGIKVDLLGNILDGFIVGVSVGLIDLTGVDVLVGVIVGLLDGTRLGRMDRLMDLTDVDVLVGVIVGFSTGSDLTARSMMQV